MFSDLFSWLIPMVHLWTLSNINRLISLLVISISLPQLFILFCQTQILICISHPVTTKKKKKPKEKCITPYLNISLCFGTHEGISKVQIIQILLGMIAVMNVFEQKASAF